MEKRDSPTAGVFSPLWMRDQKAIEFFFAHVYKIKLIIFLFELFKKIEKKIPNKKIEIIHNLTEKNKKYQLYTCNEQSQLTLTNIFFWHSRPEPV